jgi:hypothetical protein
VALRLPGAVALRRPGAVGLRQPGATALRLPGSVLPALVLALALAVGPELAAGGLAAQEPSPADAPELRSDVEIRVLDSGTFLPVSDAAIGLVGTTRHASTDGEGRLTLRDVPAGTWELTLEHLAYGEHRREIQVTGEGVLRLDIRLSPEALRLDPVVVDARRREEWPREGRGTSVRYISREVLEQFEGTGVSLADVLRARLPGLNIEQTAGMPSQAACVESRRTASLLQSNPCRQARVLVDRIPVNEPASLLAGMPLHHIESVEYLSPGEAGVRYGSEAGYGVILITSRRPDAVAGERIRTGWNYPTYDWSLEEGGQPWRATLIGAMAGNALGLMVSRPGRGCVSMEVGPDALCGQSPTTAQGIAGFLFPVLGASMGAHLMGRTDHSVGSIRTTILVSAATLALAYTVTTASNQHPITTGQRIGHGLVLVGVPVAAGLGNRFFRSSRHPPDADQERR